MVDLMSLLIGISGIRVKRPPVGRAYEEQLCCLEVVRHNNWRSS